jgi:peptidyl-prolyl cis-trans isomerase C
MKTTYGRIRVGQGPAVATMGGNIVTAQEVEQRFAQLSPGGRARYQSIDQRREYVEGILRFEALAQQAVLEGLQNDPQVVEMTKVAMVQRLLEQMDADTREPTDSELTAYFTKHRAEFTHPEMTRLSSIFFAAAKGDEGARAFERTLALKLLARVKALPPLDFGGFTKLVKQNLEDPRTNSTEGELRYLSPKELTEQYGPEVEQAAEGLTAPGDLSGVVDAEKGFYILKLQGKQAALNPSFEQLRPQILIRVHNELSQQKRDAVAASLLKKAGYSLDEKALEALTIDLKAPAREIRGIPSGFVPAGGASPPR